MSSVDILKVIKKLYENKTSFKYEGQSCNFVINKDEVIKNNKNGEYSYKLRNTLENVSSILKSNDKSISLNSMEVESPSLFPFFIRRLLHTDSEPVDGIVKRIFSFSGFNNNNSVLYVASTTIGSKDDTTLDKINEKINEKKNGNFSLCFTVEEIGKLQYEKEIGELQNEKEIGELQYEKEIPLKINSSKEKYIYHFIIVNNNKMNISDPYSCISQKQLIKRSKFIDNRLELYKKNEENDLLYYYYILYNNKIKDFNDEFVFKLNFYTNEELNKEISNKSNILNYLRNESVILKNEVVYHSPEMTKSCNYSPNVYEVPPLPSPEMTECFDNSPSMNEVASFSSSEMTESFNNSPSINEFPPLPSPKMTESFNNSPSINEVAPLPSPEMTECFNNSPSMNEVASFSSPEMTECFNNSPSMYEVPPLPSPEMTECFNNSPGLNEIPSFPSPAIANELSFLSQENKLSPYQYMKKSSLYLENNEQVNFNNGENEIISEQFNHSNGESFINCKILGNVWYNHNGVYLILGNIYLMDNEYYITPYNSKGQTFGKLIINNNNNSIYLRAIINEEVIDILIGEFTLNNIINSNKSKIIGKYDFSNDLANILLLDIENEFGDYLLFFNMKESELIINNKETEWD